MKRVHAVDRPLPSTRGPSGEFHRWCAAGELRLQHCESCAVVQHPPRLRCVKCGNHAFIWHPWSREGVVETYTVVRRALSPYFVDVPFVIAIARLQGAVRLLARLKGYESTAPTGKSLIGLSVRIDFEVVDDMVGLPVFIGQEKTWK